MIRYLTLWDYENCLEAIQLDNKTNHPEKNKINLDSLNKAHKQFVRNNKSILKTHQRFKSDKRVQSIETYVYETSRSSKWKRSD